MAEPRLYLASASPRRRELLAQLEVEFETLVVEVDERARAGEGPAALVARLAHDKAAAGLGTLATAGAAAVLGADTVVVLDGALLGKPHAVGEAVRMLAALSGRVHEVHTGVALARPGRGAEIAVSASRVRFRALEPAEIERYCAGGEPLDKAGAYAIQGRAAAFVEHLEGSYSGVVGLPLFETAGLLRRAGFAL